MIVITSQLLKRLRQNLPFTLLSINSSTYSLLISLLKTLLLEDNFKDSQSFVALKLDIIRFLGEHCCEIVSSFEDFERLIIRFHHLFSEVNNIPELLSACLTTCTTACCCLQDFIQEARSRSNSSDSNSDPRIAYGRRLEAPLIQKLASLLTQKQKPAYRLEKCVLDCLVELERNIPAVLSCYLNVLYQEYKVYQGPNKQLWNVLLVMGIRNVLKCVIRFPKANQRSISSVLLQGVTLPEVVTNIPLKDLKSFHTLFAPTKCFTDTNSDVDAICKLSMEYVFMMEPVLQIPVLCFLFEIQHMYKPDDDAFFSGCIIQLSKRDKLTLNVVSLAIFKQCAMYKKVPLAREVQANFEQASQISHRFFMSSIWYLKLGVNIAKFCAEPLSKKVAQPTMVDKNAVLLEKICTFVWASASMGQREVPYQFFSLMKLFQKQIEQNALGFVYQAICRILLQAYLNYKNSEPVIQVIILELCSKHSYMCEPVTGLLRSIWKLEPDSVFPDRCLGAFSDYIANCSFEFFLPHFADYLPLLSLVASKSSSDLNGFLELLEKSLMLSGVCQIGSLEVGNGLLQIIHNVLECERRSFYCAEIACLLQHIASNFENETVRHKADCYWRLSIEFSSSQIGQFFQSVPKETKPLQCHFESFFAAKGEELELSEEMSAVVKGQVEFEFDSILVHKCYPNQVGHLEELRKAPKKLKKQFSSASDYLDCEWRPSSIELVFEVSISPDCEVSELYAVDIVYDFGNCLTPMDSRMFVEYLECSSPKFLTLSLDVSQVVEVSVPINSVFTDSSLNSCSCSLSPVQISFQDYFSPLYCVPEIKAGLFNTLWEHFKSRIQFADSTFQDLIYNMEFAGSFEGLRSAVLNTMPEECLIKTEVTQESDPIIQTGIHLPPSDHLLMHITYHADFVTFHCVITNQRLVSFLNSYLVSLETLYRTYNQ